MENKSKNPLRQHLGVFPPFVPVSELHMVHTLVPISNAKEISGC
uniref:Uncharacterized protein n=1 Tax=Anguilla anguilla TaxID=7936 RepID=A0A0E9V720_ANGAN